MLKDISLDAMEILRNRNVAVDAVLTEDAKDSSKASFTGITPYIFKLISDYN